MKFKEGDIVVICKAEGLTKKRYAGTITTVMRIVDWYGEKLAETTALCGTLYWDEEELRYANGIERAILRREGIKHIIRHADPNYKSPFDGIERATWRLK